MGCGVSVYGCHLLWAWWVYGFGVSVYGANTNSTSFGCGMCAYMDGTPGCNMCSMGRGKGIIITPPLLGVSKWEYTTRV